MTTRDEPFHNLTSFFLPFDFATTKSVVESEANTGVPVFDFAASLALALLVFTVD